MLLQYLFYHIIIKSQQQRILQNIIHPSLNNKNSRVSHDCLIDLKKQSLPTSSF